MVVDNHIAISTGLQDRRNGGLRTAGQHFDLHNAAIGIGLGCGIGAVAISTVISFAFVMATLAIWKLEYGKTMSGSFLTMLTRRNIEEDEY